MKRSQLARGRKPLPTRSTRRKADAPRRAEVVAIVLARDGGCRPARMGAPGFCWHPHGEPLDVHEVIPRSAWAKGYLVVANALSTCRGHHDWIGANPTEAHALGLHGHSWERPSE